MRQPAELSVFLGIHEISSRRNSTNVEIGNIIVHEDWDPYKRDFSNDIALLKTTSEIDFNEYIQPICLKNHIADVKVGVVAGYGQFNETDGHSDIPRKVEISILSFKGCIMQKHELVDMNWDTQFCAGRNDTGICIGDSGSGFYVLQNSRYYLRGIVSTTILKIGHPRCIKNHNIMFTDVLKYFKDFIRPVSRNNLLFKNKKLNN